MKNNKKNLEFMSRNDLAKALCVTTPTIHKYIRTIPDFPKSFRIGRKILFKKADVERFIAKHTS